MILEIFKYIFNRDCWRRIHGIICDVKTAVMDLCHIQRFVVCVRIIDCVKTVCVETLMTYFRSDVFKACMVSVIIISSWLVQSSSRLAIWLQ